MCTAEEARPSCIIRRKVQNKSGCTTCPTSLRDSTGVPVIPTRVHIREHSGRFGQSGRASKKNAGVWFTKGTSTVSDVFQGRDWRMTFPHSVCVCVWLRAHALLLRHASAGPELASGRGPRWLAHSPGRKRRTARSRCF